MKYAGGKKQIEPQKPGHYLWYILDFGFFECGTVQVLKDGEDHLAMLRTYKGNTYYIYENEAGETLTMYHGCRTHLPPMDKNNKPEVDLYVTFDLQHLPIKTIDDEILDGEGA